MDREIRMEKRHGKVNTAMHPFNSEKTIRRKIDQRWMDRRTDGRTDGRNEMG